MPVHRAPDHLERYVDYDGSVMWKHPRHLSWSPTLPEQPSSKKMQGALGSNVPKDVADEIHARAQCQRCKLPCSMQTRCKVEHRNERRIRIQRLLRAITNHRYWHLVRWFYICRDCGDLAWRRYADPSESMGCTTCCFDGEYTATGISSDDTRRSIEIKNVRCEALLARGAPQCQLNCRQGLS